MNLVGVRTLEQTQRDPEGRWLEAIPPNELTPTDIHAAQLQRRMGMTEFDPLDWP